MKSSLFAGTDIEAIVNEAAGEMKAKCATMELLTHYSRARWNLDQDRGEIIFDRDQEVAMIASAQIIGSYNRKERSWVWAWSNPTISEGLRRDSELVREYGEKSAIASFCRQKITCSKEDCWDFTAMACKLGNAQAAFEGKSGDLLIHITFKDVRMEMK